jgi:lipopolysaccharide export system protein LptC
MAARTQSEVRHALYSRFGRRNRLIGLLRIAVPLAGALLLAVPMVQIALSFVGETVSVGGVRLQSDTLVIDSPRFQGTTADGGAYVMTADRAESRVGDLDIADLYGLDIDLVGQAGYRASARLTTAQWTMSSEHLTSNEDVFVTDSTGADGILAGADVDWPAQIITSEGPVLFTFETGSQLNAQTMDYDMGNAVWRFTRVSLDMIPAPDAGEARNPHAQGTP